MRQFRALLALLIAGASTVLTVSCAGTSYPAEGPMRKAIQTDNAPKPIGPYSQAIVEGDFIFLAEGEELVQALLDGGLHGLAGDGWLR